MTVFPLQQQSWVVSTGTAKFTKPKISKPKIFTILFKKKKKSQVTKWLEHQPHTKGFDSWQKAHAWVEGLIPVPLMFLSLSPSLSLKKNKCKNNFRWKLTPPKKLFNLVIKYYHSFVWFLFNKLVHKMNRKKKLIVHKCSIQITGV